ncbi:cysteine dioxygenase family protein [Leptospira sp. 201903074]|uniref:cysteine dioxygenase n=1 Tax=Leptospira abararensis TaxID=2810036 RepID=UPI00196639F8|nr:cysteine dioxygenase family protein [Leptospira abararensis]MBM9546861.1 cysteine dioxygenase family protein [Leptospira abararensis]
MNELALALNTLKEIKIEQSFNIQEGERKRYKYAEGTGWEILLMVWGSNSQTPIHNHNGSKGWIRMVKGNLLELCFDQKPIYQKQKLLGVGTDTYIDDSKGTHQIVNPFPTVAMSLHLYSPSISKCTIFDENSKEWRLQDLVNHSFEEVFVK